MPKITFSKPMNLFITPNLKQMKQFSIRKDGIGIGDVNYYVDGTTAYVDMIRINVKSDRRKGYATRLLDHLKKIERVKHITATDDEFTDEGRELFESFWATERMLGWK